MKKPTKMQTEATIMTVLEGQVEPVTASKLAALTGYTRNFLNLALRRLQARRAVEITGRAPAAPCRKPAFLWAAATK
jgi:GTP-sensing pleiotropic transcriptional regulator CodY